MMEGVLRRTAFLAGVVCTLLAPQPVAAFSPPELFYRERGEVQEPWKPLPGAVIRSAPAAAYEIGMRLQPTSAPLGRQAVFAQLVGGPPGSARDELRTEPYCGLRAGTPGEIVPLDRSFSYGGDGAYAVRVVLHESGALSGSSCAGAGDETTAAFTVDTRRTLRVIGPLKLFPFRATGTPRIALDNGYVLRCAYEATLAPDGEPRGRYVEPDPGAPFSIAGRWTCAARYGAATEEPRGPWGPPLRTTVRSAVPPLKLRTVRSRASRRVALTGAIVGIGPVLREPLQIGAQGARLTLGVIPVCVPGAQRVTSRVAVRVGKDGRFAAVLTMPSARAQARSYAIVARFGGTRLIDAGRIPGRGLVAVFPGGRPAFVRNAEC